MKKIIIQNIIYLFIMLFITGCNDFLDKQPTGSISDAGFWNNESDADLAFNGAYRWGNLTGINWMDFATEHGAIHLDLAGGNGIEKENTTTLMASSLLLATTERVGQYWSASYSHLAHKNTFLDNIVDCPMDETKKANYIAEIKVARAFYLFYLAFHFKDVPMPLTTITVQEANTISQTPQAEVYKQVEDDLLAAIPNLKDSHTGSAYGRVTKSAARVLLSRLYLAQGRYADAATILKAVIDSRLHELDRRNGDDSYEKLFQMGGESSPEVILPDLKIRDLAYTESARWRYPEANGGWHQYAPYNDLVRDFDCSDGEDIYTSPLYNDDDPFANRDIRLYATLFLPPLGSFPGTSFMGATYNCYGPVGSNDRYNRYPRFSGYGVKKACDPTNTAAVNRTPIYHPIMRYAEVLLSYLEAVNESAPGSVTQEILDLTINDIRNRVNLPPLQISKLSTQELLRERIRKERRIELVFEGFRYFDVLRWGTAITVLNGSFTGVKLSNDPTAPNYRGEGASASPVDENMYYQFENRSWLPHNRYWPIPQNDRNVNKNLKQNEGYN